MASTVRTWKLGSAPPSGFRLVRETAPLPPDRDLLTAKIREVLDLNIQRLTVEVGQPLTWLRLVKVDEAEELDPTLAEIVDTDLLKKVRNAEMEEFIDGQKTLPHALFDLFREVAKRELVGTGLMVHGPRTLQPFLGLSRHEAVTDVFGLRVHHNADLPDDVALLVTASPVDLEEVALTFRIPLEPSMVLTKGKS